MTALPHRPRQNPRVISMRYRAYCHCLKHGADLTIAQLAEAIDAPVASLRRALRDEKWAGVLRSTALDIPVRPEFDGAGVFEDQQIAAGYLRISA